MTHSRFNTIETIRDGLIGTFVKEFTFKAGLP
jgi:hypothetical protein